MKYKELVSLYEDLEKTSKRLEKTFKISEFIKNCIADDLSEIILLLQGRAFPKHEEHTLGVSSKIVVKAIASSTGFSPSVIEKEWAKKGDLGDVASFLAGKKKQQSLFRQPLTVKKVINNLRKISSLEGSGSTSHKTDLIAELITNGSPKEVKFLIRTVLEELRIGIAEGTLKDAIAWSFFPKVIEVFKHCSKCHSLSPDSELCIKCNQKLENDENYDNFSVLRLESDKVSFNDIQKYDLIISKEPRKIHNQILDHVQKALDLTNDFGIVAAKSKNKSLDKLLKIGLVPGTPIKVMLFIKANDIDDGFKRVGAPCAVETKYDGFRIQIHRNGKKIQLFTRRLDNVSSQFPDIIELTKECIKSHDFIMECEVIGIDKKTKKILPFQSVSQRIKRKHNIEEMINKLPVIVVAFDLLELDGNSLLNEPFKKRRELLEKVVSEKKDQFQLSSQIITDSNEKVNQFFEKAISIGQEGVMMKNLDAPYKPGSRVGYGVKIKSTLEPLDLVIIGADWGEGKRKNWLSSFNLACLGKEGQYLEIGKVGTGFKEIGDEEISFSNMTKILKPLIFEENGKNVKIKPKIIIEVLYEEIQKSPTYSSGFALRFPRALRLRFDKDKINTLNEVEDFFNRQKGR